MFTQYTKELCFALQYLDIDTLSSCSTLIYNAFQDDRRLIFLGNGGSASTASHAVADFQKGVYLQTSKKFEVIALTDSMSLVTAWSNDYSYNDVFSQQLQTWCRPFDVVVIISGSGNSENVLHAAKKAKAMGAYSIGLSGMGGGQLSKEVDYSIVVESESIQVVEDVHLSICHMLYLDLLEKSLPTI